MTWTAVLSAEFQPYLKNKQALNRHLVLLLMGPLILLLIWPAETASHYLGTGRFPGVLTALSTGLSLIVFFLAGAASPGRPATGQGLPFAHWSRYASVSVPQYLAGRLLFLLAHTMMMMVLILPSLMAAGNGSGALPAEVLLVTAYIGFSTLCFRAAAEGFRSPDKGAGSLSFPIYAACLVSYFTLTGLFEPNLGPFPALRSLSEPALQNEASVIVSSCVFGTLGLIGLAVSTLRLILYRRKAAGK